MSLFSEVDENAGGLNIRKKVKPLVDWHTAHKMRDSVINKMVDKMYERKMKNVFGKGNGLNIAEGFRMSSEYVISQVLECIPTNDPRLDCVMSVDKFGGRGLPRGKIIEISGPEESCKSAQAYAWLAALQKDPRGAIITIYEAEGKANGTYIGAAGCNLNDIMLEFPQYVEEVYDDFYKKISIYIKERNKHIRQYIADNYTQKSFKAMTHDQYDELVFRGRMSYPIFAALLDSYGNLESMEAHKKNESGKSTKTPGKHAAAHADGFRSITTPLINAMGIFIGINHTKDVFGATTSWGGKKTTTYGGNAIKLMSSLRVEQRAGGPPKKDGEEGQGQGGSMLYATKKGEKVPIGKWLSTRLLKNSLTSTSHVTLGGRLFRYAVGFDLGISYLQALDKIGKIKGKIDVGPGGKNKVIMPDNSVQIVNYKEFHRMLAKDDELRNTFRDMIVQKTNDEAEVMRRV